MSKFEIHRVPDSGEKCWKWRFCSKSGSIVFDSQDFFFKEGILGTIKDIRDMLSKASPTICEGFDVEKDILRFEYSLGEDGNCSIRVVDQSNKIIACGEIKINNGEVKNFLLEICGEIKDADITWEDEKHDPAHQAKHDDTTPTKGIPGSHSLSLLCAF